MAMPVRASMLARWSRRARQFNRFPRWLAARQVLAARLGSGEYAARALTFAPPSAAARGDVSPWRAADPPLPAEYAPWSDDQGRRFPDSPVDSLPIVSDLPTPGRHDPVSVEEQLPQSLPPQGLAL